jgi:hypothetical protein
MGWEKRGARNYYYSKERDGKHVRSVYVGAGEAVEIFSQLEMMRRDEADTEREDRRRELERESKADEEFERAFEIIQTLTEAALLASGFHTHKRQWRRRKGANNG